MNPQSTIRRVTAIFFIIVDIPLAIVAFYGLVGLWIAIDFTCNSEADSPDDPPPSTFHLVIVLSWLLAELANILVGFALIIGYIQSARKTLSWKATTVDAFWWASFLYNLIEAIHNIATGIYVGELSDLRWVGAIVIPTIGAVLSFLCLDRAKLQENSGIP